MSGRSQKQRYWQRDDGVDEDEYCDTTIYISEARKPSKRRRGREGRQQYSLLKTRGNEWTGVYDIEHTAIHTNSLHKRLLDWKPYLGRKLLYVVQALEASLYELCHT